MGFENKTTAILSDLYPICGFRSGMEVGWRRSGGVEEGWRSGVV